MSTPTLEQQEYMTLAEGVGIVPAKFRNRGYDKLDYGPGEGGVKARLESASEKGLTKQDFLAGMRELVSALGGEPTTGRRRGQKEA